MARIPRYLLPDGIFHVTSRGVAKMDVFHDDADRLHLLALIGAAAVRFEWQCHALCLMTNHYHLVVEATQPQLSAGMQRINGPYAEAYNTKYERWGHVFGERFAAWVVHDEEHLARVCRYVIGNPVRAGLCDEPADWRWSACRYGLDA